MSRRIGGYEVGRFRDAVRLLFVLDAVGVPVGPTAPPGAVRVVFSQMRLQAADFWMRNPDYLANELLNEIEAGQRPSSELAVVRFILEDDEPELRSYRMIRWRFGAYEPLDDALAVLKSCGYLVRRARGMPLHVTQHDYYLMETGSAATARLEKQLFRSGVVLGWLGGARGRW